MSASVLAQTTGQVHDHEGHDKSPIDAAGNCVKTGQVGLDHCLRAFAAGDNSLAACAWASDQMLSICGTLAKLASVSSPYLPAMARVALAACQDCETECRKHADNTRPARIVQRLVQPARRSVKSWVLRIVLGFPVFWRS